MSTLSGSSCPSVSPHFAVAAATSSFGPAEALAAISNRAPPRTNKDRMCILSSPYSSQTSCFTLVLLQAVIKRFVAQSNDIPASFVGADPDKIIAAVSRYQTLCVDDPVEARAIWHVR